MRSIGTAQSASLRRDPTIPWWTLSFATLLHLGVMCLLLGVLPSQSARIAVAGGAAGENGGGGMGFSYNGDGLGTPAPAPSLPQIRPDTPPSSATLQGAIAQCATSQQQLEAIAASVPVPAPGDSCEMLTSCDPHAAIGLSASFLPDQSFHSLHGAPIFSGGTGATAPGGQATGAAAGTTAVQVADAAGRRGTGGDGGGAVGDPGARGNPGEGGGSASGIKLVYPDESRRRGEEGTVVLAIEVLADGRHGEVTVLQSSGFWRLDQAALDGARSSNYSPATVDGRPVASKKCIAVIFRLKEEGGS